MYSLVIQIIRGWEDTAGSRTDKQQIPAESITKIIWVR